MSRGADTPGYPTGVVTFLMTDVEGSTRLWEDRPDAMAVAIARHDEIIERAIAEHGGTLVRSKGEGDSSFSVFASTGDAIRASVEIVQRLADVPSTSDVVLRVRAALYTGEAELRGDNYFGAVPNRCSRLRDVAYGGQILCAQTTRDALAEDAPSDVSLRDLGVHRLRDLASAERVYQVVASGLADRFPPLRSLDVRHNLPRQRTSFVGREDELRAVAKHVEHARLVTITGLGGAGKTRLALQAAFEQLNEFADGAFFVDLAPVSDPAVVPATVAAAVGFARPAIGSLSTGPTDELLDFLASRGVLIVLDNCEHVIGACAAIVSRILDACANVRVLATSREALGVEGEQVYPLAPLPPPFADLPETSDAVRLFAERAALVRPDFVLTAEHTRDVAHICVRLDGIPLAIELAAAQSAHLTPREISEHLDDRFKLLTGGPRHADRQQTLRAALDWSHELLTADERRVFRHFGVFPGTFTIEAAQAACGDEEVGRCLRALVAKSLVIGEEREGRMRYRLLETVRSYAEERLAEAGESETAHDRHRDHYLTWAESIPPERTYLDPDGEIQREQHNLRAALHHSEAQGRLDLVGRIASTMNRIWLGDVPEGKRWLTLAVNALDELPDEPRIRVATEAAQIAVMAIEARDGVLAQQAVDVAGDRPGMWSSIAYGLLCLNSGVRGFLGDPARFADIEPLGNKALALATDPVSRGIASFWLGQARVLTSDIDGAISALEEAAIEVLPGGDVAPIAQALLAGLWHLKGDIDRSMDAAVKALEYTRTPLSHGMWAWVLYDSLPYALALSTVGRHDEALQFLRDLLEEGGSTRGEGLPAAILLTLAAMAAQRGDDEPACALLARAWNAVFTEGIRTPIDVALLSHYDGLLRARLDPEDVQRWFAAGGSMPLDEAIAYGLS